MRSIYEDLSKIYKDLNDKEKHDEYHRKYEFLNDTINDNEKRALYKIVDDKLNIKKEYYDKRLLIEIIVMLFIFIGYISYKKYKRKGKIEASKNSLDNIDEVKEKTDGYESFNEVIKMAEEGNPFFLANFKKLYPNFHEKLKCHCPDLTEHDIKFCIYIKLNLNAKQILQYENITLRAIETKKYRLKKKLGLSQDAKLSEWILDL